MSDFAAPISEKIWNDKYRLKDLSGVPIDRDVRDTWRRVSRALAAPEKTDKARDLWEGKFFAIMDAGYFSPAGRIIAGAGTNRKVTLSNCFTMGTIPDSMRGIFSHLQEAALTMQAGGGIGYDFSTLRPKGAPVVGVAADASGPLTFMDVWDAMCRTVMSAGSRRGAMMATMRCDHPDIEAFIEAKSDPARLRMFNMSVMVTDAFMEAVERNETWQLAHEVKPTLPQGAPNTNTHGQREDGKFVYHTVPARELWDKIMRSTYDYAEPGVLFIDRINEDHNIGYIEKIATTNPCAEKPMGPYASCLLGSINLAKLVQGAFTKSAKFDKAKLREVVATAIRLMDNVVDAGRFPLEAQHEKAQADRQLGLGVTGLADALLMLGVRYGSPEAVEWTESIMREVAIASYKASIMLAEEKGAFPNFDAEQFLHPKRFAGRMMPEEVKADIRRHGIRNALLVSIAPTGTISLFAGNVSSGIEPVFAFAYTRKVLEKDGVTKREERVVDYAVDLYEKMTGRTGDRPDWFVTTNDLTPEEHVAMIAAAQKWVDSSISKTVNLPEDISFEDFKAVYKLAYDSGCKGCTTYRPNEVTGSVLSSDDAPATEPEPVKKETPITDAVLAEMAATYLKSGSLEDRYKKRKAVIGILDQSAARKVVDADQPTRGKLMALFQDRTWTTGGPSPTWGESGLDARAAEKTARHTEMGLSGLAARDALSANWTPVADAARAEVARGMGAPEQLMGKPEPRQKVLEGRTYKIKLPNDDHALYVTINDIVTPHSRRPYEVFINSKNMQHFAWTVALTRMVSAVFRRGGDVAFVVEELKAVFDPAGGAWMEGKFIPSVPAAIGNLIGEHMEAIGYTTEGKLTAPERAAEAPPAAPVAYVYQRRSSEAERPWAGQPNSFRFCPSCFSYNLKVENGCTACLDCGNSKCE